MISKCLLGILNCLLSRITPLAHCLLWTLKDVTLFRITLLFYPKVTHLVTGPVDSLYSAMGSFSTSSPPQPVQCHLESPWLSLASYSFTKGPLCSISPSFHKGPLHVGPMNTILKWIKNAARSWSWSGPQCGRWRHFCSSPTSFQMLKRLPLPLLWHLRGCRKEQKHISQLCCRFKQDQTLRAFSNLFKMGWTSGCHRF